MSYCFDRSCRLLWKRRAGFGSVAPKTLGTRYSSSTSQRAAISGYTGIIIIATEVRSHCNADDHHGASVQIPGTTSPPALTRTSQLQHAATQQRDVQDVVRVGRREPVATFISNTKTQGEPLRRLRPTPLSRKGNGLCTSWIALPPGNPCVPQPWTDKQRRTGSSQAL